MQMKRGGIHPEKNISIGSDENNDDEPRFLFHLILPSSFYISIKCSSVFNGLYCTM